MNKMIRLICTTVLSCSFLATGQGERGTFNGTISDTSGAGIPGAAVTARDIQTGVESKTTSSNAGIYVFPYLPPGQYTITVGKQGFRSSAVENITLRVAQTLTVNVKLEVGLVTESINVSSEAPSIETGTAEIGRYVSTKEFETWPVPVSDGRRQIQSFIFRSLPGTVGGEFQGSINGGQNYSHEILIEGMPLGRFDLNGGSNNEFSPSAEAVSEFKLQTGAIGAQYGGGQTAVANFAIKSGTNEIHATAYFDIQNAAFRANSFSKNATGDKTPSAFKQNNYGASWGSPFFIPKLYNGKNKTFIFASWEETHKKDFTLGSLITMPTTAFKQGDFSRLFDPRFTGDPRSGTSSGTDALGRAVLFGQIYDPTSTRSVNGVTVRDPFVGNILPTSRINALSRKVLDAAGLPDPINGNLIRNYPSIATGQPIFDEEMYSFKLDHNFNNNHRAAGFVSWNDRVRNNSPGGRWGTPPGPPGGIYQLQATPGVAIRLSEDWTIRPNLLNHAAIGYNRFGNVNESVYVDQGWDQKLGLLNTAGTHFPRLNFQGPAVLGGNLGANGQVGSSSRGASYNGSTIVMDDVTYVLGKHNLKAGFEMRFYYQNSRGKSGTGDYVFNPLQTSQPGFNNLTGNSFASFLLGAVASTTRGITVANPGYRLRYPAFYLSDDWKVTSKLTLNLGVRWEIIRPLYEVAGRMTNIDPSKPNPDAGGRLGALIFADDRGTNTFQTTNWSQISPRLGFAYAFNRKLVMRGGYGLNNMAPVLNFSTPSTFGYNGTISLNNGNVPLQFTEDPVFTFGQPYPSFNGVLPNKNPSGANGQGFTYVAPDGNRLGRVQNFNLGFQIAMPKEFVLDLGYIGNRSNGIIALGLDALNQLPVSVLAQYGDALVQPLSRNPTLAPLPYPGFTGTLAQSLRRFPQYQNVGQYLANIGKGAYDSLQVVGTRRFQAGLAIVAAYTFSKALTNAESPVDGSSSSQDAYNRHLAYSVASFNNPSNFKLTWIYELPIGRGKLIDLRNGVANSLVGGWTATGIHNYKSGNPLAISTSGIRNGEALFNGTIRPDIVLGQPIVIDTGAKVAFGTGTPYLNPAAFAQVPATAQGVPLRLGTAPRFLPNVRGPSFHGEDFGVAKKFVFLEKRSIEFRADAFNAFNRAGRGDPDTDITSTTFGRITGAQQGPRSLQLQLRLAW